MGPGRRHTLGSKGVRKAQRERLEKIALVVLSIIIFALLLAWLSGYNQVRIGKVEVVGMDTIQSVHVIADIKSEISGKYIWLYPRDSYFLVKASHLEELLKDKYPKILEVDVSRSGLTALSVTLTEREPYAEWCSEGVCHHLDKTGRVYGPALGTELSVLKVYGQSSSTLPLIGASTTDAVVYPFEFLPEERISELQSFIAELEKNLIAISSLTISPDEHYDLALEGGGYIRFYPDSDLTVLAKDLVIAFHKKISSEAKQASLEYIDARFSNKIIFKFEGEPVE